MPTVLIEDPLAATREPDRMPCLMRRGREDPHLRAGVDEEPAFGGGVDDVEELVDAGTRRHYWQPALAFPDCAAEHGGMQDLALVP